MKEGDKIAIQAKYLLSAEIERRTNVRQLALNITQIRQALVQVGEDVFGGDN